MIVLHIISFFFPKSPAKEKAFSLPLGDSMKEKGFHQQLLCLCKSVVTHMHTSGTSESLMRPAMTL